MKEDEQQRYIPNSGNNIKIRDIEEKQKINKERILLIGKNLIEIREKTNQEILEVKKELEKIKEDIKRMKNFLEIVSNELPKFAKKEELEILSKQAKMFQPLEFIRKNELNKIIKEQNGYT